MVLELCDVVLVELVNGEFGVISRILSVNEAAVEIVNIDSVSSYLVET